MHGSVGQSREPKPGLIRSLERRLRAFFRDWAKSAKMSDAELRAEWEAAHAREKTPTRARPVGPSAASGDDQWNPGRKVGFVTVVVPPPPNIR